MHHGEAREDVGAGAVPQPDDVLDPQLVQHGHQVLANLREIAKITNKKEMSFWNLQRQCFTC